MPVRTMFPGPYIALDFMPFLGGPHKNIKIRVLLHLVGYSLVSIIQQ
jgi:hypothetical protein